MSKYNIIRKDSNNYDSWTKDVYCNNYHDAYQYVSKAADDNIKMATVGGISIVGDYYEGKRWIQWEIIGTYVCLHEIWLDYELKDSSICFKFDNDNRDYESPVAITISSNRKFNNTYNKYEITAILCIAMKNGFIYRINLDTIDENISLLASSVHHNDGQIVDIYRGHSLNFDSNKPPLSALNSQHKIICGMWKGPHLIVFGLNGGDILFVNIRQDNRLEETLVKDSVGLQAIWSGIIGSRNENKEIVAIATDAHSIAEGYVLTISSSGSARLWNTSTKQCMCQTELSSLVSENANDIGRVEKGVAKINIDSKDEDFIHAIVGIDYNTGGHRSWYIMHMTFSITGPNRAAVVNVCHSDPSSHPVRPALLDIELDPTNNGIVAVWRSEEKVRISISSLPLSADESNSFTFDLLEINNDDEIFRNILRCQLTQILDLEERLKLLNTCMIRKIFNSKYFTVETIQAVFRYEVPEDFRVNHDSNLDNLIGSVREKCLEWASRRCDEADAMNGSLDDYNETFVAELENVYFDVLTLCIRREGRLQSNIFSGNGCLILADKLSSSCSTTLARRNGEAGILVKAATFESVVVPSFSNILSIVKNHVRTLGDLQTFYHDLGAFFFNPINFDDDEGNDQWISTCLSEMCDSLRGATKSMFVFGSTITRSSDSSIKNWFDVFVSNAEITTSMEGVTEIYDFNFTISSLKSPCGATLVAEIMKYHVIEKREIAISTAIILTLFAKGVFGPLSRKASAMMVEYIKRVKFSIVYCSYLLWMDAVRPCQTTEFIRLVDLHDICPNSKTSPDSLTLNCFNSRSTAWSALWLASIYSAPSSDSLMEQDNGTLSASFLKFLAPMDVVNILLQGGQFSSVEKLSSLMMAYSESIRPGSADLHVTRVANSLFASRLRTMKAFSALNSLLLWLKNSNADVAANKSSVSEHLHRSVEAILAAANISLDAASISSEIRSFNDEAALNSPSYDHAHAMTATRQKIIDSNLPLNCMDVILDAQDKVAALTATKYLPGNDIFSWSSLFLLFCKASHLTDSAEFLRRIRLLVPPSVAGNVILRANYALIEIINDTIIYFESMNADKDEESTQHATICNQILNQLLTDLQTGWCQIFEIALDSKYFDEALSAILKLIDIESLSGTKSSGQRMYWQDCLTALVSRVCDVGRFGWLCSLPNITHNKVNITELIADELETLAIASSPFSSTILEVEDNSDEFDINIYYECLCAYFIRHRYFREAAAVMYAFVRRIDSTAKFVKHVSVRHVYLQQMRALTIVVHCLSIVPPQQAYILYPLELTKRVSDIFTNSNASPPKFGYLTLPHIHLMLSKVSGCAQVADANDYNRPQPINDINISVLLKELCSKGCLSQAFSLVKLVNSLVNDKKIAIKNSNIDGNYDNDMRSITLDRKDIDYPIESLARYCSQEIAGDGNTNPIIANELQKIRRNLDVAATSTGAQALKNESNHVWDMLLDILKKLDHADNNWSMHKRACETILNENCLHKLPESLISSYCGFEFSKNEKKITTKYSGDPYSLLRLLIEYKHFITASDIL